MPKDAKAEVQLMVLAEHASDLALLDERLRSLRGRKKWGRLTIHIQAGTIDSVEFTEFVKRGRDQELRGPA